MSRLILFEDEAVSRFLPLTWTRPLFALRCGIFTLHEAVERAYGTVADALYVRPFLTDVVRERSGLAVNAPPAGEGMALLLNGRLLASQRLPETIPMWGEPCLYRNGAGEVLGAWLPISALSPSWPLAFPKLPEKVVDWAMLAWPWELFQQNGDRITAQAAHFPRGEHPALRGVHLIDVEQIYIAPSATVQPGVVLDASAGPIVIDEGATVMANAVVQGPSYVGPHSQIKVGAKIYHGTSMGQQCKVGGEVEETIFQRFSNKQHDGFLGHAFVGEWCNFGADTNNSDLKNNYSTVSVWSEGAWRDSGSMFVGLMMGDHAKTGINSSLNTGTVVGVSCNLFGAGLPPKFVPSFSWGSADALTTYQLDKALETAERVMARRNVTLSVAEADLLRHIYHATAAERGGT